MLKSSHGGPLMWEVTTNLRLCQWFSHTFPLRSSLRSFAISYFPSWSQSTEYNFVFLFSWSALIGHPVDHTWNFESATNPSGSSILLFWQQEVHQFVADVGLFFVVQEFQFDYKDARLSYHTSREVDWDDKYCVRWFPYVLSSGNWHFIIALVETSEKRIVGDVQVKKCVEVIPVKFKLGSRSTIEKKGHAVSSVLGYLADFLDAAGDMPISENGFVEEDTRLDLRELM